MSSRRIRFAAVRLSLWLVCGLGAAQTFPTEPPAIPDSYGLTNTVMALKKLPVTARVLFVMAHLDDEGYLNAMLPYASWVLGARTGLLCYIRGEKGHNIYGTEFDDGLAILRIGEMMNANRYYGISDLYFSRFAEFRVQSLDESLRTFGRENLTREMAKIIRIFRPHVLVSLWSGTQRDGHGHHQMVALVAPEAAEGAGLPDRYPDMTAKGLLPWRPLKVYRWLAPPRSPEPGRSSAPAEQGATPATTFFRLDGERYYPILGRSLSELALAGFRSHLTQGKGIYPDTFPGNDSYALQLVSGPRTGTQKTETSLFDGIDAGLTGLLEAAPSSRNQLGFLPAELTSLQGEIEAAISAFRVDATDKSSPSLARGLSHVSSLRQRVENTRMDAVEKASLVFLLKEKEGDFTRALAATLGLEFRLLGEFENMVPGEPFRVNFSLRNGSPEPVAIVQASLGMPAGWEEAMKPTAPPHVGAWKKVDVETRIVPPRNAAFTQLYWRRPNRWRVEADREDWLHFPYSPPEVLGEMRLRAHGVPFTLEAPLKYNKLDHTDGGFPTYVQVTPAVSVTTDPEWSPFLAAQTKSQQRRIMVQFVNNSPRPRQVAVTLDLPSGWKSEPREVNVGLQSRAAYYSTADRGAEGRVEFQVTAPPGLAVGGHSIGVVVQSDGTRFSTGYQVLRHRASTQRYLYRPAAVEAKVFDLKLARPARIGYVSASLDVRTENPALNERFRRLWRDLGSEVTFLTSSDLYYRDLTGFDCIIIGYYTYDRSKGSVDNNPRLLNFVEQGGVLIVTSQNPSQWNAQPNGLGPYPSKLFSVRVPYDAKVELARSPHPVLTTPNRISTDDFREWDEDLIYTSMDVANSDPRYANLMTAVRIDGSRVDGGLTVTRYGKGHYVFAGTYVVRQCAMISQPGPFRLMANILALTAAKTSR